MTEHLLELQFLMIQRTEAMRSGNNDYLARCDAALSTMERSEGDDAIGA
jgi:hypothetical protein